MTVKPPRDGWDTDERKVMGAIGPLVEDVQRRHADDLLSADDRQRLLRRIQRDTRPSWVPLPPSVLAAAAALVVIAGAWIVWHRAAPLPPASPSASATVASKPAPPAYVLTLSKPDIRVSPAALTYRGQDGTNSLLADLTPAFDALRRDDYLTADRVLTALGTRYPAAVEVPYYQGVAQLFLGHPAAALERFSEADRRADAAFAADILWYRAIATERVGDRSTARRHLHALCAGRSARSSEACAAEQQLQ